MSTKKSKDTVKVVEENSIPEGFEEIKSSISFIKLLEDQSFIGIFKGIQRIHGRRFNNDQICWIVSPEHDPENDYLLPEKTVMENYRLNMEIGDTFFIQNTGDTVGANGMPYTTYKFGLKKAIVK